MLWIVEPTAIIQTNVMSNFLYTVNLNAYNIQLR